MNRLSKFIGILSYCLIGILLFSCTRNDGQEEQPDSVTTGRTIRKELTLRTTPMQGTVGAGATRATTQVPLSEDEKKIHNLWVLQFSGRDAGSKLIKKGEVPVDDINPDKGVFSFEFEELAGGGYTTVYLLANVGASALNAFTVNSTTLAAFEAGNVEVVPLTEAAMITNGLPMVGAQSFDYANSNPGVFTMKSLLAKVSFKYTVASGYSFGNVNLFVNNLADAVPLKELAAGAAVQHPGGIDYTGTLTVVGDGTYNGAEAVCYLPENLAGRVAAITQSRDRGGNSVPQGATYISVGLLSASTYSFYLGDGTASDFNMQRHCQYTFDMKLKGTYPGDKRVTVGGSANCYIVTNPGTYAFDATVRGNGDESVAGINYSTLPDLTTATEARVIWQTGTSATNLVVAPASVKLNGGKVSFTTGSATEGNSVIGIFASSAANAPCLWSWHIWRLNGSAPGTVTGKKQSATTGADVDVVMMDRNLGAYNNTAGNLGSIGLLYQWGRKDPFPGPAGFNTTEPGNIYGSWNNNGTTGTWNGAYSKQTVAYSTGGTEAWAIKYPTTFITYNSSTGDWMSTKNDNLWGTPWNATGSVDSYNGNQGTKSIYDPCPIGYRVPPQDTWSKQTGRGTFSNNGIILGSFHSSLWFPAAGRRLSYDGSLVSASSDGYYWSSSPHGSYPERGGSLYFYLSGTVSPQINYYRAFGFSVRCVSE